ncbi:MAG: DDE-type integrase/transposase/recombinase [Candidatus Moranbacteria bacterium]|nr:DDE-type integrase/transposase/recombinase [Candidatus Moranbacteria bacterium]
MIRKIEQIYSDNGLEYKGNEDKHAFMLECQKNTIAQRFTKVESPQTNGKAERVIRTIMDMWHTKTRFKVRADTKN